MQLENVQEDMKQYRSNVTTNLTFDPFILLLLGTYLGTYLGTNTLEYHIIFSEFENRIAKSLQPPREPQLPRTDRYGILPAQVAIHVHWIKKWKVERLDLASSDGEARVAWLSKVKEPKPRPQ